MRPARISHIRRGRAAVPAALLLAAAAITGSPAGAAPVEHSESKVLKMPPPIPLVEVGSSSLVRTDNGITMNVRTSGLEPGHAVTLWLAVANDPDDCAAGIPGVSQCGPADHDAGRGQISVHYAGGHVVGENGTARYGAQLREGDTSRALFDEDPGLLDARGAEVIAILKTHGPATAGLVSDQLHTFAGGCADQRTPPHLTTRPGMLGAPGDNDCAEIQLTAHTPAD